MDNAENIEAQVEPELTQVEAEVEQTEETQPTAPEIQGSVPLKAHVKLRERAQAAEDKQLEMERKIAAMEQERSLAKLAIVEPKAEPEVEAPLIAPNPYDFADDDEWIKAQQDYNKQFTGRLKADTQKLVEKQLKEREQAQNQTQAQAAAEAETQRARDVYLDRAEKLNAPDFMEAEDKVLGVWSKGFLDHVVQHIPNAEQVVYTLSQDLDKALELAEMVDKNMLSGGTELVKYAAQLSKPTIGSLPEPDEPITGGAGGVVDVDAKIEKLRAQKLAGKITMQQFMDQKRELSRKAS